MTKIFATGTTGYIGGDALYAISTAHPEYEIAALVRSTEKGARIAKQYPSVRLVYGGLDDVALIEKEASEADIVLHFAHADHEPSALAISKGLAARSQSRPGFFIHTSGTGILTFEDLQAGTFGIAFRDKVYNDLEGIKEVTSLPDAAIHRNVDKIVLEAGTTFPSRVKTAIVCPPTIYGIGRGPDSQRSIQLPELCRLSLIEGQAIMVNQGLTYWGHVHIQDLSALYLKLTEEAAAGGVKDDAWGTEGYYFCENGEHVWGEVSQWVADQGKMSGYFKSSEVKSLTAEEASERRFHGQGLWGANSRARAKRAREVLDWQPTAAKFKDEVETTLDFEAELLGLRTGLAKVADSNK
ncbi:NAD(P)-binding protein [Polychaeton citri CBS 116435]|uniref:NAD(P)-binding protein n=1 Tax=Polychaeton citri CBS 116435 TaxID=1314669 RepID=A0A9P4PYJ7_9PEZI|nr:NAD(P)-binding protein [Polychaeton citri CBS 116435]